MYLNICCILVCLSVCKRVYDYYLILYNKSSDSSDGSDCRDSSDSSDSRGSFDHNPFFYVYNNFSQKTNFSQFFFFFSHSFLSLIKKLFSYKKTSQKKNCSTKTFCP